MSSDTILSGDQVAIARLVPRYCAVDELIPFAKVEGMMMPCRLALELIATKAWSGPAVYRLRCPQHGFVHWGDSEVGDGPPF